MGHIFEISSLNEKYEIGVALVFEIKLFKEYYHTVVMAIRKFPTNKAEFDNRNESLFKTLLSFLLSQSVSTSVLHRSLRT